MGQVTDAFLKIRGRLIFVQVKEVASGENNQPRYGVLSEGKVKEGVPTFEDREIFDLDSPQYCLPVSVSISLPEVSLDWGTLVYGLLLEKVGLADGYRKEGVSRAPKGACFLVGTTSLVNSGESIDQYDWNQPQWHGQGDRHFGDRIFKLTRPPKCILSTVANRDQLLDLLVW